MDNFVLLVSARAGAFATTLTLRLPNCSLWFARHISLSSWPYSCWTTKTISCWRLKISNYFHFHTHLSVDRHLFVKLKWNGTFDRCQGENTKRFVSARHVARSAQSIFIGTHSDIYDTYFIFHRFPIDRTTRHAGFIGIRCRGKDCLSRNCPKEMAYYPQNDEYEMN